MRLKRNYHIAARIHAGLLSSSRSKKSETTEITDQDLEAMRKETSDLITSLAL